VVAARADGPRDEGPGDAHRPRGSTRRLSDADEVAKAALYLASDDASNVTATEIVVDSGATGAPYGAPIHTAVTAQ